MNKDTRQHELDVIDAGGTARTVLQQRAGAARASQDQTVADLSAELTDEQALDTYGLDLAALRQGIDLDQPWPLP